LIRKLDEPFDGMVDGLLPQRCIAGRTWHRFRRCHMNLLVQAQTVLSTRSGSDLVSDQHAIFLMILDSHVCRSDDALVDIALDAGFADQSHLSRVFKLHTGMLPSEFRWLLRRVN
jgi:AraC-like DNA-binding protein